MSRRWRLVGQWTLALILAAAWLTSCGAQSGAPSVVETPEASAPEETLAPDLTVAQVAELAQESDVVIVDVREPSEYSEGHIPGAVLIPLGEIPERLDEVPADKQVVLVCRSGNRSSQAYQYLASKGFTNVHNMLGGMVEWQGAGYEVER